MYTLGLCTGIVLWPCCRGMSHVIRAQKDHSNIGILQNSISGIPLIL